MKKVVIIVLLCCSTLVWAQMDTIRVGVLLPLQAEAVKRDKNMDRFVDFYSGVLLAVYERQNSGMPIEIHTYDVGKSTNQLEKILSSGDLDRMDMIIGPVYSSQIRRMSEWAKLHQIKTLLPFSSEVYDLATNPYLLQFNPSYTIEANAIAENLASKEAVKCILVDADEVSMPASVRELQKSIKDYILDIAYVSISEIMNDSLSMALTDGVDNVLLLNTERFANVRMMMPQILRAAQGKHLTLLSRYSWQEEPIILPQLYTTVFHQQMDTLAYNALFHRFYPQVRTSSHPCYDLLGYDLMNYVLYSIEAIQQTDGLVDEEDILSRYYSGLQSDVQFERVGANGGYQNTHIDCIWTE